MDESLKHHNPNPSLTANPLSKLFFWWVNPLLKKGYVRTLEVEDMYNPCPEDQSEYLGERLEKEWKKELVRTQGTKKKPSLVRALFRIFGLEYMLFGIVLFLEEATKVVQPLLLGGLIRYFTPNSTVSLTESYLYAMGVSLCALMLAVSHHPYFFGVQRIGMKMRIACCSLLYRKSLRLSNAGLSKTTTGQIVNLMSNDVNRFDQAVIFLHFLWIGPLEAIAVLAILWKELGASTLAGFAVLLLLVPIQGWMGKLFSKFRQKTAKYTDERVKVMNEIIAGMRVIKMYCWEKPFGDLVASIRRLETDKVKNLQYVRGLIVGPFFVSAKLIALAVFLAYSLGGGQMSPVIVFMTLALYQAVRLSTTLFVPFAITFMMETKVTLDRAQFLFAFGTYKVLNGETSFIRRTSFMIGVSVMIMFFGRHFIFFGILLAFVGDGRSLRASGLYITLSSLNNMRKNTLSHMSSGVRNAMQLSVTVTRVETFLMLDELEDRQKDEEKEDIMRDRDCYVKINSVTAKWDDTLEQPTLQNISASVKAGKLLAIIGPVGAGKSSLLMSVLQELPCQQGSVEVKGRVAYVSQQPWVFSASLRQNITFGNKYVKNKYERILKACALNKDIEVLPHGDVTLIGDRGVSLSGGQRARVSLARALYMDADVYLLDDPLSAVDAHVGRHIFENVIQGLLKDKPRILVTHQLQFLKPASQIIILKEGEMIGSGTFDELSTSGVDFSTLLKRDEEEKEQPKTYDTPHPQSPRPQDFHHHPLRQHSTISAISAHSRTRLDSASSYHSLNEKGSVMSLVSIGTEFEAEAVQLPEAEERGEGTVGWRVYYEYFKAGAGILKFLILTILCLAAQGAYIASDWWLSYWSNKEEARFAKIEEDRLLREEGYNVTNITIPFVDSHFNVGIFSAIIGGVFVFGLLRALMFFKVAVDASQKLHNTMFGSILRAKIGFFDTNPVGRVLNRFSKDIGHMDDLLPITFFDFVQCFLLIVGIVCVAGVVNPWVFIAVFPLCILFFFIRRFYLRTSRHVKRLEGTTRSPVFSHLSASLQGLHTIRAFGVQEKFVREFDNHQDLHTEAWFLFLATSRWLAIRLDWLCAMFVTAVSFCSVLAADSLDAGLVGLSMTYAMTLMGMFQWGVRQSAEVENQMISVERVLEYSKLPSEADLETDEKKKPPGDWPQQGVITADKACLKYSQDAPLVLKELTFTVRPKEKVGIVGRTGAGKSSLITMLFRLVEPSGVVLIDNINVQSIGLHDLRNKISIIPQDPVLFTGKLRRNLDPFEDHEDSSLWKALTEVQLKQAVEDLPHGLDTEVSEGGINFSVGQRQLICLARAILRQNKILMIDEATANVDPRTDSLIQQTIREKFRNCTVLTIAHRLHTIMDSDRLLVLDDGKVIEFDAPYLLLQKPGGFLYKLVEQTGKAEALHLMEIAKAAYNKEELPAPLPDGNVTIIENSAAEIEDNFGDNTNVNDVNTTDDDKIVQMDQEIVSVDSSGVDSKTGDQEKSDINLVEVKDKPMKGDSFKDKNLEARELIEGDMQESDKTGTLNKDVKEADVSNVGDEDSGITGETGFGDAGDKNRENVDLQKDLDDSDTEETSLITKSDTEGTSGKSS